MSDEWTVMTRRFLYLLAVLCLPVAVVGAPASLEGGAKSAVESQQVRGKPSAGFSLASAHSYQVAVGEVQPVAVVLRSEAQQGQVRVTVATSEPELELLSPTVHTRDLSEGTAPSLALELLPHQSGRYYVMLTVELTAEGVPPRAQSLGFVVQAGKPEKTGAVAKSARAPGVIALPVQETIRTDSRAKVKK
jgi:hypothetical protein